MEFCKCFQISRFFLVVVEVQFFDWDVDGDCVVGGCQWVGLCWVVGVVWVVGEVEVEYEGVCGGI